MIIYRLLQKKKYDAVFEVSRFLPDDGNTGQRMNIVLRYLGKYEDTEAIKLFLERYEKEGIFKKISNYLYDPTTI